MHPTRLAALLATCLVALACNEESVKPPASHDPPEFLLAWGGTVPGRLYYPQDVAVGPSGDVYVADGYRVLRFTSGGRYTAEAQLGDPDHSPRPYNVAVTGDGNVFIREWASPRLRRFGPHLAGETTWDSWPVRSGPATDPQGNLVFMSYPFRRRGATPADWAVELLKVTGEGEVLARRCLVVGDSCWGEGAELDEDAAGIVYATSHDGLLRRFSTRGRVIGTWMVPSNFLETVCVDRDGNVFVPESGLQGRIHWYGPNGRHILSWNYTDEFHEPMGILGGVAVDDSSHVYVVDWSHNRVYKYRYE